MVVLALVAARHWFLVSVSMISCVMAALLLDLSQLFRLAEEKAGFFSSRTLLLLASRPAKQSRPNKIRSEKLRTH